MIQTLMNQAGTKEGRRINPKTIQTQTNISTTKEEKLKN